MQKFVEFSKFVRSTTASWDTRKLRYTPRLELSSEQTRSRGSISVCEVAMLESEVNCGGSCMGGRDAAPRKFMLPSSMMAAFADSRGHEAESWERRSGPARAES